MPPSRQAALARLVVIGLVIAAGLGLILTVGISRPEAADNARRSVLAVGSRPQPNAAVPPRGPAAPVDRLHASDAARLKAWARRLAGPTRIPPRVLQAYGLAEMWMRSEAPNCGLSWSTVAGIGGVASEHGQADGRSVDAEGVVSPALIGARLGPLRVLPETWKSWRFRAARDGERPDPQNVDDAAVTVARYLCSRAELTTPRGWWSAVRSHTGSTRHTQDVFTVVQSLVQASER